MRGVLPALRLSLVFLILPFLREAAWADALAAWQAVVERAAEAEDAADYKSAKALFREAYAAAVSGGLGPARVWPACERLAVTQAVAGNLGGAQKSAGECAARFARQRADAALQEASARLLLADIQAARARLDDAMETLDAVRQRLAGLPPADRGGVLIEMGEFHLAVDMQAGGAALLEAAQAALAESGDPDDARYVDASCNLAESYRIYHRRRRSKAVLQPIVRHARERMQGGATPGRELAAAWRKAGALYAGVLRAEGDDLKARVLSAEIRRWRAPADESAAKRRRRRRLRNYVSPRLVKKTEPRYTPGAVAAKVQGEVVLAIEVRPDGRAHDVRVIRPLPYGLSWNAVRAVRKWRFEAAAANGEPLNVPAEVRVSFRFR